MPKRGRKAMNLTLDDLTRNTLKKTGAASSYIDSVVYQRAEYWRGAIQYLHGAGWEINEILATREAMFNFFWTPGCSPSDQIAFEMVEAAPDLIGKWRLDSDAWTARARQVRESPGLGFEIWKLVQEWSAGNDEVTRGLERHYSARPNPIEGEDIRDN